MLEFRFCQNCVNHLSLDALETSNKFLIGTLKEDPAEVEGKENSAPSSPQHMYNHEEARYKIFLHLTFSCLKENSIEEEGLFREKNFRLNRGRRAPIEILFLIINRELLGIKLGTIIMILRNLHLHPGG